MTRALSAAIFLSAIQYTFAQETIAPYTSEHTAVVAGIMSSFENTPTAEPVEPDEEAEVWSTVENFAFGKDRGSMPMITDLDALHPAFREKIVALIEACRVKGIELAVVETYRTRAKQNEYRSMGRIYTRSGGGRSKHQYGLAVDVVPVVDSVAVWHNASLWKKVGIAGERLGLRWGGRWRHPYDPGHFEWTGGVTTVALEAGAMPRVPAHQYPCLEEDLAILRTYWTEWEEEQSSLVQTRAQSKKAMK
jgi:hypothetical protein